jgi:GntR family transcriptional regulator
LTPIDWDEFHLGFDHDRVGQLAGAVSQDFELRPLGVELDEIDPQIVNIDESTSAPALRPGEGTPAERYVFMRRVHSRDGRAYCVINIHLDERIFRRSPQRFRDETVIPLLTKMKGVTIARAHQVLTIGTADMDVARLIDVPVNAPVAEVRRVFRDSEDRVIYLAEVTYRGDAVHVEMDLKP